MLSEMDGTAIGITLIGVIVGISVTVALGVTNISLISRVLIFLLLSVGLLLAVKWLTSRGTGPLYQLARWTISA